MNRDVLQRLTTIDIDYYKQMSDQRLDKDYAVYLIENQQKEKFILKKATQNEVKINELLSEYKEAVSPKVISIKSDDKGIPWLTIDYVDGPDYTKLSTEYAIKLGKSLAKMANFFNRKLDLLDDVKPIISSQVVSKQTLLSKLPKDTYLYKNYQYYINRFVEMPKSICHDDLLPINIIFDRKNHTPKIIDWEHGRQSSYITDIARATTFYSDSIDLFQEGLSFLGEEKDVNLLLTNYFFHLNLTQKMTKYQFDLDYHLESLNQLLLNINHVEKIQEEYMMTEWEKYFYDLAISKSNLIHSIIER